MRLLLQPALVATVLLSVTSCSHNVVTLNGRHRQPINVGVSFMPTPPAPAAPPLAACPTPSPTPAAYNEVTFRVFFDYGKTALNVPPNGLPELLAAAKTAERIHIKGRTDGSTYSTTDERVALLRALAMRSFLVAHGVPATSIDLQFASAADYLDSNSTPEGRARNRRVEVAIEQAHG